MTARGALSLAESWLKWSTTSRSPLKKSKTSSIDRKASIASPVVSHSKISRMGLAHQRDELAGGDVLPIGLAGCACAVSSSRWGHLGKVSPASLWMFREDEAIDVSQE